MNSNLTFTYDFSEEEVKALYLLLRKNEETMSNSLEDMKLRLENFIYDSMTIDEVENFFNENLS
ncbi:MAG: hypothetical protein K5930_11130 [Treponemataceae bacterium]|nr:hypothetical protein [Treponemataceae bacterium]